MIQINNYEEMILRELHEFPDNMLPNILKILKILKESISPAEIPQKSDFGESGFCGAWDDERTAEEIIEDIYSSRTGFRELEIEL